MLRPGQIVKSTAGRDRDMFFAVVSVTGSRAAIADGKLRRLAKPKLKNVLHLAPTKAALSFNLADATDKRLRKALLEYREKAAQTRGGS
jgi:ribosomal protein L14E/L6E/L27E